MCERSTKKKARLNYCLLILGSYGSYVTIDFIEFRDEHKILLLIFSLYSTYSLQPLDVVVFKLLSSYYLAELTCYSYRSYELIRVKTGDFIGLF